MLWLCTKPKAITRKGSNGMKLLESSKTVLGEYGAFVINDEQLSRLQSDSLSVLLDVESVCDENGLHYSLAFGTLLGAIRHKGYIPWDDDVDIALPFDEIDTLVKETKKKYGAKYFFAGMGYGKWPDPFSGVKIMKNGTVANETNCECFPIPRGIGIDVFPIMSARKSNFARHMQGKKVRFLSRVCSIEAEYRYPPVRLLNCPDKKIRKYFRYRRFLGFCFSYHSLERWIQKLTRFSGKKYKNSPNLALITQGFAGKEPFQTDLSKRVQLDFEGHPMYVFSNYLWCMKDRYGSDFMTLPPVEKRERHPLSQLDFGDTKR